MKEVIGITPNSVATLHRDNHDVSGKYIVHTKIFDDAALERNKRIRLESLLPRGSKLGLHYGERIDYAFSITSESWGFFVRDYPDIAYGLISKDEDVCYESARKIAILHPEWLITAGYK